MQAQALHYLSKQIEYSVQALPPESYSQALPLLQNASVGKHIRHLLEIFLAFCQRGRRKRKFLRCSQARHKNRAREFLAKWQEIKEKIANTNASKLVKLKVNYSLDTNAAIVVDSSLEREFIYALDHGIRHLHHHQNGIDSPL